MIEGKTDEETLELIMFATGSTLAEARQILAIERGQSTGDLVEVDPDTEPPTDD